MSDTPRTFQARLLIEAGDWRNEKDCTDYALKLVEELELELNELNAWKAGMKGVEEFYAMRHQRDEWRKCAESLAGVLVNTEDVDTDCVDAAVNEFIRLTSKP